MNPGAGWVRVASAEEVGERPLRVEVGGRPLVLVRLDGEVVALADRCVHRGASLSLGWVDGGCLVCAYHGWRFGSDGVCRAIPALGDARVPERARVAAHPVVEADGAIWCEARTAG